MKTKKPSIKQIIAFAALGSAAFAYADDPIYTGTFEVSDKGNVVGSLKANIAVDADIDRTTVTDIKTSEADSKVITEGGITSESIDLTIKATSTEGDTATAFQAGNVDLNKEIPIKEGQYKNPEAITLSDGGSFKGTFEANAEKGTATALSVNSISADENEIQIVDADDQIIGEIKSKPGSVDINAVANGKEAVGIKVVEGIDAGNINLNATANAFGGNAIAIDAGFIRSEENVEIKSSAVSKATFTENKDKTTVASVGNATGVDVDGISAEKIATIDTSAYAEGGNAIALKSAAYIGADELTINAVAETAVVKEITEVNKVIIDGKEVENFVEGYKFGDATAIEANGIIETGFETEVSVADFADKKLPADILKDVSRTINASATAGSYVDVDGKTKGGNATAYKGVELRVGNEVEIVNTVEDADKDDAEAKMAKAKEMPIIDLNTITPSKTELNGSFVAKALGGNAVAIDLAGELEVGSEVEITSQYKYVMEEVLDEEEKPVLDAEGNVVKQIKLDKNGKPEIEVNAEGDPAIQDDTNGPIADKEFRGDFNADVYAEGINATGIKASEIEANVNGNITAIARTGNATAIEAGTDDAVINGKVTAEVYNTEDITLDKDGKEVSKVKTSGEATAIKSTDGNVKLGDGAIVSARQYVFEKLIDADGKVLGVELKNDGYGLAITNVHNQANTGLTVEVAGTATAKGDVKANSPLNINGKGTLIVEGGTITGDVIKIGKDADLSLAAGYDGKLAKVDGEVKFKAIELAQEADKAAGNKSTSSANAMASSKRAQFIAGSATALVNDKYEIDVSKNDAFKTYDKAGTATDSLKEADLKNIDGNMVNFDYTLYANEKADADGNVTAAQIGGVKVNKLSYFQSKAVSNDQRSLAKALDSITTIEAGEKETAEETSAREAAIQSRRDFKANVDTRNLNDFMPQANTQLAQINSEMLMNVNLAKAYRMTSVADSKRNKSLRPSTTNNAAELISINMLGSQDGQGMAEGFDFWSAGALAAIERDFSENLLAGISLGGIYNKIEGDNICDSNSTSFLADVYAVYTMKDMPLDIFANFGYAHSWNEASRSTPDGTASIDYDSNAFNTLGGVAYTFKKVGVDGLTIKPMAMYNIVYLNDDSANEEGAGFYNANVSSNDYINVRTLIGLEVKYDIDASFAVMARAFWVHEFCDTSYDANYKINAGNSFMNSAKYRGIDASEDAALLGLGLNYNFSDRVSAFLDYSATLRDDFTAHGLDLGVKFKF
ncbi:MAG: autotransporter outer membrane beta-barrel domain-containing protein [Opitutales bacterium]|nr:autotransporter outer membrane beta-barrel domain-containing protein [Opitutales bacterium]